MSKNKRRRPGSQGRNHKQAKGYSAASKETNKSNDINWWNNSPLFSDATRVPFNRISGDRIASNIFAPYSNGDTNHDAHSHFGLPTVMRINYVPTLGYSEGHSSPLNRAFTSLFAGIYSRTTGAMQFTQANLAINTLALDSIVTNIGLVKRILGISQFYSSLNYAYPRWILKTMQVDPDTVIGHQDEIRRRLNNSIMNLNAIRAVNLFAVTARHYQLATNMYADMDDIRGRVYFFQPTGYYVYMEAGENPNFESESLKYVEWNPYLGPDASWLNINDILDAIDFQLSQIRHSSAFGLVAGSVQRTFPEAELLQLAPVGGDEVVLPVYDVNMLHQISNMTLVGSVEPNSLDLGEDVVEDTILVQPRSVEFEFGIGVQAGEVTTSAHILNSFNGDISPEFIMEATRLMVGGEVTTELSSDEDHFVILYKYFGTELPTTADILAWKDDEGTDDKDVKASSFTSIYNAGNAEASYLSCLDLAANISHFHHAPFIQLALNDRLTFPMGPLTLWTSVDLEALDGLHEAALLSAFNPDQYKPVSR